MWVIVAKAFGNYVPAMASAVIRLLALIALVLMPLGMGAAPALAAPAHHKMMAAGPSHCDEQPQQDQEPVKKMDCMAMCAALPATDGPAPVQLLKPKAPRTIALVTPFTGVVLDIATPPPRRA